MRVIENLAVSIPPISDQIVIADFLDRETAKIDGLVGEQRRLIELLKEKRQAVISHAVTKGLNPHAPMKPSGIEWLGDVPEHWESSHSKTRHRPITDGVHLKHQVLRCQEEFLLSQFGVCFGTAAAFRYSSLAGCSLSRSSASAN